MIIDAGANAGDFAVTMASKNPRKNVIAIEPIPDMCLSIEKLKRNKQLNNLYIHEAAINVVESNSKFNVANHHDKGVSSLLDFADENIENDNYWGSRKDLYHSDSIDVRVLRLDTILQNYEEEEIDFLKIDTQGLDFNVLKSLGKKISLLKAGMLEVSIIDEVKLYKNEENDFREILKFLDDNNFYIYSFKPNDHASNEFNLYFCRKGISYKKLEKSLGLLGIPLYDGKHFWHAPSNIFKGDIVFDFETRLGELSSENVFLKNEIVKYQELQKRSTLRKFYNFIFKKESA